MSGQPSEGVKRLVRERATPEWAGEPLCERCGRSAEGGSYHHRRLKGQGGDRRPDTNLAGNIVLLCGSGTTGCHGLVHGGGHLRARADGWVVSRYADPTEVPVEHGFYGRVMLRHSGEWVRAA